MRDLCGHRRWERPIVVTVLGFLGLLAILMRIPDFVEAIRNLPTSPWYLQYGASVNLFAATGIIGIWSMRRWGLVLYAASMLVGAQLVYLAQGQWSWRGLLVPAAVSLVCAFYWNRMR